MKTKMIIILTLSIMLFMFSCESSTKSEEINDLIGIWHSVSSEINFLMTTNSDQKMIDVFSEAIGGINLTGDINTSLKYLSNQYGSISVSETNDVETSGISITCYDQSIYLSKYNESNPMQSLYYQTDNGEFTYDYATNTLTINPTVLYKLDMTTYQIDSSSVINVSGTLQNQTIDIKANTPTDINLFNEFGEFDDNTVITIEKDGTWSTTSSDEYGEYNTTGTWEEKNGKLIIIETDQETNETIEVEIDFKIEDGNLTIINSIDYCEEFEDYNGESCYSSIETYLGIEDGSISDLKMEMESVFSQTPPNGKTTKNFKTKFITPTTKEVLSKLNF